MLLCRTRNFVRILQTLSVLLVVVCTFIHFMLHFLLVVTPDFELLTVYAGIQFLRTTIQKVTYLKGFPYLL
jgi:hypothetical protein